MLIRYKNQNINLNNVSRCYSNENGIEFKNFNGNIETWYWEGVFETEEERDKVYNLIMNKYFTDIEELTNEK